MITSECLAPPHLPSQQSRPIHPIFMNQTKLANLLHARELALRLKDCNITVVALHPGWANSGLFRELSYFMRCCFMGCCGKMMGVITKRKK